MTATNTPPTQDRPPRRFGKWLWGLLIVSVAANLLVVGALAGAFFAGRWHHGPGGAWRHQGPHAVMRFAEGLPAERKQVFLPLAQETRRQLRELRKAARDHRRKARELLKADVFDREAFESEVNQVVDLRSSAHRLAADMLIKSTTLMTDKERQEFAKWRKSRRFGRHGRWRDRGDPGEGDEK